MASHTVYNRNTVLLKPIWEKVDEWGLDRRLFKISYTVGGGFVINFTVIVYNRKGKRSEDIKDIGVVRTSEEVLSFITEVCNEEILNYKRSVTLKRILE